MSTQEPAPLPARPSRVLPGLFGIEDESVVQAIAARATRIALDRGEYLFRAGTPGDDLFLVLSGRLVAVGTDARGRRWTSTAMTAGATVGEMALLTGGRRSADVMAVRRSELMRLSRSEFEAISASHPAFLLNVSRVLAERLARAEPTVPHEAAPRVIAVVGLDEGVEHGFSARLFRALAPLGGCLEVDAEAAARAIGRPASTTVRRGDPDDRRLDAWLAEQEARHDFVLLDAGPHDTAWLARCLDHADHVLLVARADARPGLRPFERALHDADRAPEHGEEVSLALLHPPNTRLPSGTARWLDPRRLDGHHHLRDGNDADFQRLARLIAKRGIGVVLGGGGALGAAHVGVLEALAARGIPIDAIGGTSSGGGVAAQYAMGLDQQQIRRANVETFVENNPFYRVTLPVVSVCDRGAVDRAARDMFGDAQIEDLWTPFFCVSTDLTRCVRRVHRRGPLWLAVRATTSLPGILPPVIDDGSVLVDGGVLDNLPVGPMKELCRGPVVAVDVTPETDLDVDYTYEQMPDSLRALFHRFSPRTPRRVLPTIPRVLLRTITVSSQRERERSHAAADLVLKPPVEWFNPMDFRAFHEIREVAHRYAAARLADLDAREREVLRAARLAGA